MATLNVPIQLRTDSSENWDNSTLILLKGEIGIEFSENTHPKIKIGDGLSIWKELDYFSENNLLTGDIDPAI